VYFYEHGAYIQSVETQVDLGNYLAIKVMNEMKLVNLVIKENGRKIL